MKFKNLLALILALVMVFSAGCAPKAVEEPSTPAIEKTEPTEVNVIEEAAKAYFENKPENSYIVPIEDVVKKIDASEDIFLLDIRSAKDYELGHLVGAVNIPWGPEFATSVSNLPSDKPVYLYCVTGQTAGQTVALLNVLGYDATSIKLGWNLGISKMEGIDKYTETTVNEFGEVAKLEMNQEVFAAVDSYYKGLADVKDTTFANYKINEADAKALIDAKDANTVFLSVRKAEDYLKGDIPTALNIPYGNDFVTNLLASELPKDKKIVVNCYTGQTAGQSVAIMRLLGYDAVSMNGGLGTALNAPFGWTNAGYDVSSPVISAAVGFFKNKPENSYMIDIKDLTPKMDANEDMLILDIRSADDYAKGHLKGAVNIPWGPAFTDSVSKLPADKPIYLYCVTGQTAGQTVALLNVMGYDATSIRYGFKLGISAFEDIETYTETTINEFGNFTPLDINETVLNTVSAYYAGLADVSETIYKNYKISNADAKALLDAKDANTVFLDVRKAEDYAKGHIATAMNIPYGNDLTDNLKDLPKDKKIVVNCYTGQTAGQTVAILKLLGYDAVSLDAGMGNDTTAPNGWLNSGFEVVQ